LTGAAPGTYTARSPPVRRRQGEEKELFRVGLPEILIVLAVVVILVKPKDLPGFFRKVGRGVRQLRGLREEFTRSVREMQDDLDRAAPVEEQRADSSGDEGGGI
jgi:sec-independent protein translocase protein TatB